MEKPRGARLLHQLLVLSQRVALYLQSRNGSVSLLEPRFRALCFGRCTFEE